MKRRLLALCDSPTVPTGFGRVADNLLRRWRPRFESVDVWAINHNGWPHDPARHPYRLFPPTMGGYHLWCGQPALQNFITRIQQQAESGAGYTDVWLMQDTFGLSRHGVPGVLKEAAGKFGFRTGLYFPVDAPLEPGWLDIVRSVDIPVAYTEYGRAQVARHDPLLAARLHVLPHGVETAVYRPLGSREALRAKWFPAWERPGVRNFVMVNVNANQRRKGVSHSLEILAGLKRVMAGANVRPRLVLHMAPVNPEEQMDLRQIAGQMGLVEFEDYRVGGSPEGASFVGNWAQLTEAELNELYNAADIYLTTTLGEGWGLGITEALAAGCPAAAPDHTSCTEIAAELSCGGWPRRLRLLPVSSTPVVNPHDNSRVRWPVDVAASVDLLRGWIREWMSEDATRGRESMPPAVARWLSWDRIADEWMKLYEQIPIPTPAVGAGDRAG